jgi:NADH-quinone oxidoreductase subunit L
MKPIMIRLLWLIPVLPLLAAGLTALLRQRHRSASAGLAIGSMLLAFVLSCFAFASTLGQAEGFRQVYNFPWFDLGAGAVQLGWVLDPLTAIMLVMVTLVGLLIFIYSVGYMAHDPNFTRFFCFLSLFAAAMLGLVIANSLLLFFICWELVGLASYLLIGFWYHKPSAAAAAKKAFITTRIGDLGFLLGLVWLYSQTGTLLFYDQGNGCLEASALAGMVSQTTVLGLAVSTGIALLIFCGAMGKSGQVPLHVWLPDAMEGPTPVSALIHAATMVAAGVFLVARVYPLMSGQAEAAHAASHAALPHSAALTVVTWVGVITAVFAACIAVAQTDIKRILAYSTVSQLGYMMLGLGVGGVAVGMFHLITHAFFKALLFLGAGSVIHGCDEEQDIRYMGGLKRFMPVTFATYAIGMMALAGVPVFFSGFWSKDEILHAAHGWPVSHWPFYLGLFGALLTAFYMTRQVCYVFLGEQRRSSGPSRSAPAVTDRLTAAGNGHAVSEKATWSAASHGSHPHSPHESPPVMTAPLVILAVFAMALGFVGTPAWPWFQSYLEGQRLALDLGSLARGETLSIMGLSVLVVALGIGAAWWLYGLHPVTNPNALDPLESAQPGIFGVLRDKFYVDELYEVSVVRLNAWWARTCDWLDRYVWNGAVQAVSYLVLGLAWLDRFIDEYVVNLGFDKGCKGLREGGGLLSRLQAGQAQNYLRAIGVALAVLVLLLTWGCRS